MQKILLVLNAQKPDRATIQFAIHVAATTKSKLTGLFVENLYHPDTTAPLDKTSYFKTTEQKSSEAEVVIDVDLAVTHFVKDCTLKNVTHETSVVTGEPIQVVMFESRFADLLIITPDANFYNREEEMPSHFTKELLHGSECPVLLAPTEMAAINEIVFCYDGSASAAYAIKQFTYLFGGLANKMLTIVEVTEDESDKMSDKHRRMMDWLGTNYASVTYNPLVGDAKEALFSYFWRKKDKLVVMGSYGRSMLSRWFKSSTANQLIRTIDLPIFITHFNH